MPEYGVLVVGDGVARVRTALIAKQAGVRVASPRKAPSLRSHSVLSAGCRGVLSASASPPSVARQVKIKRLIGQLWKREFANTP